MRTVGRAEGEFDLLLLGGEGEEGRGGEGLEGGGEQTIGDHYVNIIKIMEKSNQLWAVNMEEAITCGDGWS